MPLPYEPKNAIQVTSTATADPKTITLPAGSHGCYLSCRTTNAYFTLNGDAPSATNGCDLVAGAQAILIVTSEPIIVASSASANSVVNAIPFG
jgi:hypothetical protein